MASIKAMSPAEAFTAVGDAIGRLHNPMQQTAAAMEIFGRSGAQLLPVFKNGLSETAREAERLGIILDQETIVAGDKLGDTLDTIHLVGMALLSKVLRPMVPAFTAVAQTIANVMDPVQRLIWSFQYGIPAAMGFGLAAVNDWAAGMLEKVLKVYQFTGGNLGPFSFMSVGLEGIAGSISGMRTEAQGARWAVAAIFARAHEPNCERTPDAVNAVAWPARQAWRRTATEGRAGCATDASTAARTAVRSRRNAATHPGSTQLLRNGAGAHCKRRCLGDARHDGARRDAPRREDAAA
jgi:hypothetical protein